MTQYTHRITLVVPKQYIEQANHLASVMGESAEDINTFKEANWQDADGNLYAVCSALSKPVVLGALTSGLPDPLPTHAVGADIRKAQQALVMIELYDAGVKASPNNIVLAIDYDPHEVFDDAGLSQAVHEDI